MEFGKFQAKSATFYLADPKMLVGSHVMHFDYFKLPTFAPRFLGVSSVLTLSDAGVCRLNLNLMKLGQI